MAHINALSSPMHAEEAPEPQNTPPAMLPTGCPSFITGYRQQRQKIPELTASPAENSARKQQEREGARK